MAAPRIMPATQAAAMRGIGFAILAYAAFATADALIKLSSARFGTGQIALFIALFAMLPVMSLTAGRGGIAALWPVRRRPVVLRAFLGAAAAFCAWHAFALLPLAETYAILFAAPLLVTALGALVLKEEVGWRRWCAAGVGFAGVVVMVDPRFEALGLGHLLAVGAALLSSLSFIMLRVIGPGEKSAAVLFMPNLVLGLAVLPMAIDGWVGPSLGEFGLLALAGLLMGSAQASLVFATREAPAVVVAPFQYTQMLWAVLFGALLFGNLPTPNLLLGLAVVVASGLYTLWRETVRRRPVTVGATRAAVPARAARFHGVWRKGKAWDARAEPEGVGPGGAGRDRVARMG
ncbi:MAG: DMT family transporter [Geminicoccaceae bacterium]|nr:DMT family transporter [Geminicoccaceae bacterium]